MLYWSTVLLHGLRIGISTIKAFCDVTNKPCIGISSLESLCYNIQSEGLIASIIDAKNDNVYFSLFEQKGGFYTQVEDFNACDISSVIDILKKYRESKLTFVGDGSLIHKDLLKLNLNNIDFSDSNEQTSTSIIFSAFDKFKKGFSQNSSTLIPLYLRKSQAERSLDGEK